MLAAAVDHLPAPQECRGGCRYEPKWDGFRAIAMVDEHRGVRLFSRRLKRLNGAFPEVVMAVFETLPDQTVVDGEIVRWSTEGRLDFGALQRRNVAGKRVRDLARAEPCHFVLFDVLEARGTDVRPRPLCERRELLEDLLGSVPATSLIVVSLHTADVQEARQWLEVLPAQGIEGLLVKAAAEPYAAGQRRWLKLKHRDTTEAIIGGVTGSLEHPEVLILGRRDPDDGRLRVVGRTTPVPAAAHAELAAALTPAGDDHPWPPELPAGWAGGLYGSRPPTRYIRVVPDTVAEVSIDVAVDKRAWRHPARYVRLRPDMAPEDVPVGVSPE
jgi:ATP-dependent DNA ligase